MAWAPTSRATDDRGANRDEQRTIAPGEYRSSSGGGRRLDAHRLQVPAETTYDEKICHAQGCAVTGERRGARAMHVETLPLLRSAVLAVPGMSDQGSRLALLWDKLASVGLVESEVGRFARVANARTWPWYHTLDSATTCTRKGFHMH